MGDHTKYGIRGYMLDKAANEFSAMRLAFLLWSLVLLVIWAIVSYRTNALQDIPESVVTILGILITGKVVQRYGEK